MATYAELKEKVLILCEHKGSTTLGAVAEIALEEAMKYVASQVELDGLYSEATYTWGASDTGIPENVGGFGITDMMNPLKLFVKSATGTEYGWPHEFRRWENYKVLFSSPVPGRPYILEDTRQTTGELPERAFTKNPTNDTYILYPNPSEGMVVTLDYQRAPLPYSDGATPELNVLDQSLLIFGATTFCKEYINAPQEIINPYNLFQALNPQIEVLRNKLLAMGGTRKLRISNSYRP